MDATTQTKAVDSPVQQNQQYNCSKCKRSFASLSALGRHSKDKHKLPSLEPNPVATGSASFKPTYKPSILEENSCPFNYHVFWLLKAKTRRLLPNRKRYTRFVAPRFPLSTALQLAEQVNCPDLLDKEFVAFAQAYDTIVQEKDYTSIDRILEFPIGVINAKQDLVLSGRIGRLKDIQRRAPTLPTKNLKILTEDMLLQFFAQARIHMLENSIPWDDFPAYYLSSAVLGAEIYNKVIQHLHGYPEEITLRKFSCFIQQIILGLLPIHESYSEAELRIIEEHKANLLGPVPNINHIRTMLQADSCDLVAKSPYFKQVQNIISDESKRLMIEAEKTNLLHKIIANTTYEAKLYELLIASGSYKTIHTVPYPALLDHLQNLIIAEKKSEVALFNANRLAQTRDLVLSEESPVVLPPIYFNGPPPIYGPPPNFSYLNTPPPPTIPKVTTPPNRLPPPFYNRAMPPTWPPNTPRL